jgi:serine/threonine-protein kinase
MSEPPGLTSTSGIGPGTQLNGIYEIDALVGVGGMGEVFKGHNVQTGDPIAIKMVLPEYAQDPLIMELFRKEARVLFRLAHDAIVRYYVFTIAAEVGRPYLAMEYVDGPSLAERIKSGPLTTEEVTTLKNRLADGLHKAHEVGIIHRDISPDNVILPEGRVDRAKIVDFGIAKSATVGGATVLGSTFAGKYNFVSPEQLGLFGGEVTARSDVYSLGLVLAAALLGRPIDMGGSQLEVVEKRRAIPDLSGIGAGMQPLLRAMLEPDPARRLGSMAEVRDWRPGLQSSRGETVAERIPLQREVRHRPPLPRKPEPARSRAKAGPIIGAAALFAILIGGGGGWWYVHEQAGSWYKAPSAPDVSSIEQKPNAQPTEEKAATPALPESPPELPDSSAQSPAESANKDVSATGPEPAKTEIAAIPPAPVVEPKPVDRASAIAAFMAGFDGGDCFFASGGSDAAQPVVVYYNRPEALGRFKAGLEAALGGSPRIEASMVSDAQCSIINALRSLASDRDRPRVQLSNSVVPSGAALEGSISDAAGRDVQLFLVDDEGQVMDLRSWLTRSGDKLGFSLPVTIEPGPNAGPMIPGLVLAVASSGELTGAKVSTASELAPKLVDGARRSSDFGVGVGYFQLARPKG